MNQNERRARILNPDNHWFRGKRPTQDEKLRRLLKLAKDYIEVERQLEAIILTHEPL